MGLRIPTEDMEFDTEDVELRSLDGDLREIGDSSFFREDMPAERSGRQLIGTASEWEKHAEACCSFSRFKTYMYMHICSRHAKCHL